ncbi:MAG: 16S rRNA (guanine(527)-N(7))-methyltransferase RsmG [Phycisphaerae bacterium]|nr:16S rRNA (guanine(527)-N(7))-methyltransferase RsmG [Phycisphaerae bacterium]
MSDVQAEFHNALREALAKWNLSLTPAQFDLLAAHYAAMVEYNQRVNLTRITDPAEAAVKHYADSLSVLHWVEQAGVGARNLLDIGTGAGFPAIPLAIAGPDWSVVALEATGKKVSFLIDFAREAKLTNLHVEHAHSAHWKTRRRFDLVTLKAVGSLRECFEQAGRFLCERGHVVVFKTAGISADETAEAEAFAGESGLTVLQPFVYELEYQLETLQRLLCVARKA